MMKIYEKNRFCLAPACWMILFLAFCAVFALRPGLVEKFVKLAPEFLTLGLLAFFVFNAELLRGLVGRLSKMEVVGMKVELSAAKALAQARTDPALRATVKKLRPMPEDDVARVMKRAALSKEVLKGRRILWVDDMPTNNEHEVDAFKRLGLDVVQAETDAKAMRDLVEAQPTFDILLSDMDRGDDHEAGTKFLTEVQASRADGDLSHYDQLATIFYITKFDPAKGVPGNAFGITDRPDELLHLVLDALERKRRLS